jgi:ribonuclease J
MTTKISFLPLGGITDVTRNMYLYEYEDSILILDCGLGFPNETMVGVDLLLPDISYLLKTKKKIVGMVLTHGHEDHIGGLPYILPQLPSFPIYGTALTAALSNEKLKEFGVNNKVTPVPFEDEVRIGPFDISFIRVTHSVPDTSNVFIKTPAGNFYHGSDFKFDITPYDGKKTDFAKISKLSSEGVICLMSDALGADRPGASSSELDLLPTMIEEMRSTKGKIILTTYSSNISRLNQAVFAAAQTGRKVCFIGRSLLKTKEIAQNMGYMKFDKSLEIEQERLRNFQDRNLLLLVAGSQGQEGSALSRLVNGDIRDVTLKSQDTVIFSSDIIPGNEVSVNSLIDEISKTGARVLYTDVSDEVHVSGHGRQYDLMLMMSLVRPQKVMPIGSTLRHSAAYKTLAIKMGFLDRDVLLLEDGQEVIFENGQVHYGQKVHIRNIFVDEVSGGEVESFVLRDREKISKEGIVVIMVELDSNTGQVMGTPNIITRGFSTAETQELNSKLVSEIKQNLDKKKGRVTDWSYTRRFIGGITERFIQQKLHRRPLVLPVVMEV